MNEKSQIETSLKYIDMKMSDISKQKNELKLFEADLLSLRRNSSRGGGSSQQNEQGGAPCLILS